MTGFLMVTSVGVYFVRLSFKTVLRTASLRK